MLLYPVLSDIVASTDPHLVTKGGHIVEKKLQPAGLAVARTKISRSESSTVFKAQNAFVPVMDGQSIEGASQ